LTGFGSHTVSHDSTMVCYGFHTVSRGLGSHGFSRFLAVRFWSVLVLTFHTVSLSHVSHGFTRFVFAGFGAHVSHGFSLSRFTRFLTVCFHTVSLSTVLSVLYGFTQIRPIDPIRLTVRDGWQGYSHAVTRGLTVGDGFGRVGARVAGFSRFLPLLLRCWLDLSLSHCS